MSIEAVSWAIHLDANLNPTEKLTLVCLANYADADGVCFPGVKRLAGQVGVSQRQVRRVLDQLEGGGILTRTRRRRANGTLGTYEYTLGVGWAPPQVPEPPADTDDHRTLVSTGHPRPDQRTPTSARPPDTGVRAEPSVPEPSVTPSSTREPEPTADQDDDDQSKVPAAPTTPDPTQGPWLGTAVATWAHLAVPRATADELDRARTVHDAYRQLLVCSTWAPNRAELQLELLLEYAARGVDRSLANVARHHRRRLGRLLKLHSARDVFGHLGTALGRGAGADADDELAGVIAYAAACADRREAA